MATIALYANKINNMSGLLKNVKTEVNGLKSELCTLASKCAQVDPGICDLQETINTISATTKTQTEKVDMLQDLQDDIIELSEEAERIDGVVADTIERRKDDFYEKYSYLKPECEKSGWEKFCDGCAKVAQWCKENWEALLVLAVAIIAIAAIIVASVLTFGGAAVLVAALVGAVVGLAGQLIGDLITLARTGKWEGGLTDYLASAIGGAIGGILAMTGNVVLACAADAAISTMLQDSLGSLVNGDKKTLGEMLINTTFNAVVGGLVGWGSGKIMDKALKLLPKNIKFLRRFSGTGSYSSSYKMVLTKLARLKTKITYKTIRNGILSGIADDFLKNIVGGFGVFDLPSSIANHYGAPKILDQWMHTARA